MCPYYTLGTLDSLAFLFGVESNFTNVHMSFGTLIEDLTGLLTILLKLEVDFKKKRHFFSSSLILLITTWLETRFIFWGKFLLC